jgi:type IV pilus assembly protein PilM
MGNNTVSIYIDDSFLRVMVTHGKRIVRIAEMPMETGLVAIDSPAKETDLARKVQQFLKFNKVGGGKIILGISGLRCLTRPLSLPELPKAMIGEAVIREAKRVLPVPLEQLYLSWQTISVSGGKTHVFIAAVPRQCADMVIRIMTKAGYKPYMMEIKPLALARLSKVDSAVILDIQPKEFDIVIIINGIPQPVRTVSLPQDSISLEDKLEIVKEELKRTLEFVKSKADENQLKPESPILVAGELADHPESYEAFTKELGYKVEKLASPLKYLKYLEPSPYLVNAGLALKVYTKEAGPLLPNFNALPEPYLPMHISVNKLMAIPAALGAIGIIALLWMSVQGASADISESQGKIDNNNFLLEKRQAQKKEMNESIGKLEQQVKAAEAEYQKYKVASLRFSIVGKKFNSDLNTTVDNIKTGISFSNLTMNESSCSIDGAADDEEEVFQYIRNLTASGRFKEITINQLNVTENKDTHETVVEYTLNCVLEEKK